MSNRDLKPQDIARKTDQLVHIDPNELPRLPFPYEDWTDPEIEALSEAKRKNRDVSLDGVTNLNVPVPATDEEKEKLVAKFLDGLHKLLSKENNWTRDRKFNPPFPLGNPSR